MHSGDLIKTMRIDVPPTTTVVPEAGVPLERQQAPGDTTAFTALRQAARSRSQDYQRLLESVYDGVFITNASGRIASMNTRAAEFFRTRPEGFVGASILGLISGADQGLLVSIRENLRNHRYTLIEARCLREDGTSFPSEIAVNHLDLGESEELCFFVRDVSVRKAAQRALEEAVTRLKAHDRARSEFVSNVSHELRTPLTSMIYAVSNMLRGVVGPLPDRVRDYLDMLQGDCRRLLGTVNDILDLRKIENEELTLNRRLIPFDELVLRNVRSLQVQAEQKGLKLSTRRGPVGLFANCDPQKMERVVLNVTGNAVKFTPDGGSIDIEMAEDAQRPGFVRLSVEDSGIGIPPEALSRVTLRYFTVGEQPTGSGLGLAISKEIVELHGGELLVESPVPGRQGGTAVCIRMPLADPATVLAVDDEPGILDLLRAQLEQRGYRVVTARSEAEAWERVSERRPDAVILDLLLAETEGAEFLVKMKGSPRTARVPIVALTGADLTPGKRELIRQFSVPSVQKPWDEEGLVGLVVEALLRTPVQDQGRSAVLERAK